MNTVVASYIIVIALVLYWVVFVIKDPFTNREGFASLPDLEPCFERCKDSTDELTSIMYRLNSIKTQNKKLCYYVPSSIRKQCQAKVNGMRLVSRELANVEGSMSTSTDMCIYEGAERCPRCPQDCVDGDPDNYCVGYLKSVVHPPSGGCLLRGDDGEECTDKSCKVNYCDPECKAFPPGNTLCQGVYTRSREKKCSPDKEKTVGKTCKVVDCSPSCGYSKWSPWSPCSVDCFDGSDPGIMSRTRELLHKPKGEACKELRETRPCENLGRCYKNNEKKKKCVLSCESKDRSCFGRWKNVDECKLDDEQRKLVGKKCKVRGCTERESTLITYSATTECTPSDMDCLCSGTYVVKPSLSCTIPEEYRTKTCDPPSSQCPPPPCSYAKDSWTPPGEGDCKKACFTIAGDAEQYEAKKLVSSPSSAECEMDAPTSMRDCPEIPRCPECTPSQVTCVALPDEMSRLLCAGYQKIIEGQNCVLPSNSNCPTLSVCPKIPCEYPIGVCPSATMCTLKGDVGVPSQHQVASTSPGYANCAASNYTCMPPVCGECTPDDMKCDENEKSKWTCKGVNSLKPGRVCDLPVDPSCTLKLCTPAACEYPKVPCPTTLQCTLQGETPVIYNGKVESISPGYAGCGASNYACTPPECGTCTPMQMTCEETSSSPWTCKGVYKKRGNVRCNLPGVLKCNLKDCDKKKCSYSDSKGESLRDCPKSCVSFDDIKKEYKFTAYSDDPIESGCETTTPMDCPNVKECVCTIDITNTYYVFDRDREFVGENVVRMDSKSCHGRVKDHNDDTKDIHVSHADNSTVTYDGKTAQIMKTAENKLYLQWSDGAYWTTSKCKYDSKGDPNKNCECSWSMTDDGGPPCYKASAPTSPCTADPRCMVNYCTWSTDAYKGESTILGDCMVSEFRQSQNCTPSEQPEPFLDTACQFCKDMDGEYHQYKLEQRGGYPVLTDKTSLQVSMTHLKRNQRDGTKTCFGTAVLQPCSSEINRFCDEKEVKIDIAYNIHGNRKSNMNIGVYDANAFTSVQGSKGNFVGDAYYTENVTFDDDGKKPQVMTFKSGDASFIWANIPTADLGRMPYLYYYSTVYIPSK